MERPYASRSAVSIIFSVDQVRIHLTLRTVYANWSCDPLADYDVGEDEQRHPAGLARSRRQKSGSVTESNMVPMQDYQNIQQ